MSVWIEIEPEVSLLLTDKNELKVRDFLYSKFPGSKELILKDEEGRVLDVFKLEDML